MKVLIIGCDVEPTMSLVKYFIKNTDYKIHVAYESELVISPLLDVKEIEGKFEPIQFSLTDRDPWYVISELFEGCLYDYVINFINLDKEGYKISNYILYNSLFPNILAEECECQNIKLINVVNNDVYLFKRNNGEFDIHDDITVIGRTKSLGEICSAMTIRISKFITDSNFESDNWTGMTSNMFAEICHQIIEDDLWKPQQYNLYSITNDGKPDEHTWSEKDLQLKLKIKSIEKQIRELEKG